ncbi:glycosyltransferase [Patescibacteria group bacterium]|nr:glycosyltransferase [Patescibacteria group bacterium]
MTSRIGIYQFASGTTPDKNYGYSIDDQTRALILALFLYHQKNERRHLKLARIYLNFIERAQLKDGRFHNFADFKGRFIDRVGSEDCFGRTIWALGVCQCYGPRDIKQRAEKIFKKSKSKIKKLRYIRSKAYASLGLIEIFREKKESEIKEELKRITQYLIKKFKESSSLNWSFFEDKLIYANAILPLALLSIFEVSGNQEELNPGLKSLDFLNRVCRIKGFPAPIGFEGWYPRGQKKAQFGQQPIDVCDMVLAAIKAYELTGEKKYSQMAKDWFSWFLGNNIYQLEMYDPKTGGCFDGIFKTGINPNQGAESTICFHLANLEISNLKTIK